MNLYDVGFTSLFAKECESLAEIALILNRTDIIKEMNTRKQLVIKDIMKYMWNEQDSLFYNVRFDSNIKRIATNFQYAKEHISPTSFYLLFLGILSDQQATQTIIKHLQNPNEFCVSKQCKHSISSIPLNDPNMKG
jgi:hypothetical protein